MSYSIRSAWTKLLDSWISDSDIPLFIRKASLGRGRKIPHDSNRILIPADNGPAHWSMELALNGECPQFERLASMIDAGCVPVAMILKKTERELFGFPKHHKATLLNKSGWKVCHIHPVRLPGRKDITHIPMEELAAHFKRFLDPSNMFVVPLSYSALGELPEVIEAVKKEDA